jgi:hypothetical protein
MTPAAREVIEWLNSPDRPADGEEAVEEIVRRWGRGVFREVCGIAVAGIIAEIEDADVERSGPK